MYATSLPNRSPVSAAVYYPVTIIIRAMGSEQMAMDSTSLKTSR
jgi:hypothetical protein